MESRLNRNITIPFQFQLKRYAIDDTACSMLLFDGIIHSHTTAEGDNFHFYEQEVHGICYGAIVVQLQEPQSLATAERMLTAYLNGVRKPWEILHSSNADLERFEDVVISTDYYQDSQGYDWKLKGYTDGYTLSVLYAKNIGVAPVHEHDAFLNGFVFSNAA